MIDKKTLTTVPTDVIDALQAALQPTYDALILQWSAEDLANLTSVAVFEVLEQAQQRPGAQREPQLPRCRMCFERMPNCGADVVLVATPAATAIQARW